MRVILSLVAILTLGLIVTMMFGLLSIDQTRPAQLPSISVQGGQTPTFSADVAKVDVGTRNETVEVPTVSVQKP